jgi:integrase
MARHGDGLYLRGRTWYLDCRINGTRHVVPLGKDVTRSVARDLARVKRTAILKGEAGIGRKRKDLTLEDAAKKFQEWADINKRPRTAAFYDQCLANVQAAFPGKRLGDLHPFLLERYKRSRAEAGAKVMVNRELTILGCLFNRCREWGLYEGENPVRLVKRLQEPKGRLRYLEVDEEAGLLAAAAEPYRTLFLVGIHTGIRIRSEGLPIQWSDVDFTRNLITVQAAFAKNGQARSVPMNRLVRDALQRLKAQGMGPLVFLRPGRRPIRSLQYAFERACEAAELKDVSPHTLRHTFASRLAMAGVDLRTIQELGGWHDLAMVERYAHLSPSHKAAAVERLVAISQQISQPAPPRVAVSRGRA